MSLLVSILLSSPVRAAECGDFDAAAIVDDVLYANLADAVAAAPRWGTVWICPGERALQAEIDGSLHLTLAGLGAAEDVVLSGQGSHRVVRVVGEGSLALRDLTLAEGWSADAGGALWSMHASVELDGVIARDNQAYTGGAVAVGQVPRLRITDSRFQDNQAFGGGSVAVMGADRFELSDSSFEGGVASFEGGDLALGEVAQAVVTRGSFLGGQAGWQGGAIALLGGSLRVVDSDFDSTWADQQGGAIFATDLDHDGDADDVVLVVEGSDFLACQAGQDGGALRVAETLSATVRVRDSRFSWTWASARGGALSLGEAGTLTARIEDSRFEEGSASEGGAIDLGTRGQASLVLSGLEFLGNSATQGGAISLTDQARELSLSVSDSVFAGNRATRVGGSAVHVGDGVEAASLVLLRASLQDNLGGRAAVRLSRRSTLSARATDWGAALLDNGPADVASPAFTRSWDGVVDELTCAGDGDCSW